MKSVCKSYGLIGGDRRQAELSRLLEEDGYPVWTYGLDQWKAPGSGTLEQAASADAVVLPLPLCRGDGVLNCQENPMPTAELFRRFRPDRSFPSIGERRRTGASCWRITSSGRN